MTHLKHLLSKYKVITYKTEKDITLGLLRFNEPTKGYAYLFEFQNEEKRIFHSVGMKFPIDIYFFNKNEEIVFSYQNVQPGVKEISSKSPCQYVVEIPK